MTNFSDFRLEALANLLVRYTSDFATLLSHDDYTVEEYTQYKQALKAINEAIELKINNHSASYIIPGTTAPFNEPKAA